MYSICIISNQGLKPIASFESYSEANLSFDEYDEKYPYALIEILPAAMLDKMIKDSEGYYYSEDDENDPYLAYRGEDKDLLDYESIECI